MTEYSRAFSDHALKQKIIFVIAYEKYSQETFFLTSLGASG